MDSKQKIITRYDSVRTNVPREKIYVHLDKSTYLAGDTIWFKAYLLDASIHIPSTISQLIYAEIINESGSVVQRLSLPTAIGLTWGSFVLNQEKYQSGKYLFRAYTNWMQNFGDTHFFKKDFKIMPILNTPGNAPKSSTNVVKPKSNNTSPVNGRKLNEIDVQFFPEGGELLANRSQKVGFKALNTNGAGIAITGEIVDSKQQTVSRLATNDKGMGYFNILLQADESYSAKINYNGLTNIVNLPKVKIDGSSIAVENEYKSDSISFTAYNTNELREFTMVGQSRGIVCFVANVKFNNSTPKTFKLPKNIFPTGVCQVILMDDKMKVTNERNFFVNHHEGLKINIGASYACYGVRDSIPVQLKVTDSSGNPISGAFSVAVTDDYQVAKNSVGDENIVSYFLLHSDLKGEIENPAYYFNQPTKQKHDDLEALMLTQGWVSYDWNLAKKPAFSAEKEYVFSGTVTNVLNKPISKAKILLLGRNKSFMMIDTVSNEKGEFMFNKLPMMDSASIVIQALNEKGKKGTIGITMNEFKLPLVTLPAQKSILNATVDSIVKNLVNTKIEAYKLTNRDGLLLNEVNIIGKRTIKGSKNLNGPGGADLVLTDADLTPIAKKTLYDVLNEKVEGFREGYPKKSTNRIFFIGFNPLKIVIDGIELDFFYNADQANITDDYYRYIKTYLDYYNAEDILGIEVMNRARYSWTYKSRFMHPMDENEYSFLEITTKTGQGPFLKKAANMYLLKPINYGDNKIFYSPKYTSLNKNDKKPDFRSTIYWNPNILTNEKGEGNFSFFSADKPGTYTLWIEGTDLQGNFGFQAHRLVIK